MLYTKPINEISYQDVVDFCDAGHLEGFILEYKRDFPSNEILAKTIAALANTYGGILIIGVNAPSGKPTAPFEGIAFDPSLKYEEKIESIVLSHTKEPVFPEIRVCDPVSGKTFVVIRVAESHLTPHRVGDNRKIYVRTGQSSTPNEEATWDKIEWLASRRKKSEDFRELLIAESERYFKDSYKLRNMRIDNRDQYFGILSLRIIPLFPQNPLIPYKDFAGIGNEIQISGMHSFPRNGHEPSRIQNGVHRFFVIGDEKGKPADGKQFEYLYLNSFGVYLYKIDEGNFDKKEYTKQDGSEGEESRKTLYLLHILVDLYLFLESSKKFYKKLGYWGTLQLQIELKNALGVLMPHPLRNEIDLWGENKVVIIPSDDLRWEKTMSVIELNGHTRSIVVDLIDAIAWSLDIRYLTEERILKMITANFGDIREMI